MDNFKYIWCISILTDIGTRISIRRQRAPLCFKYNCWKQTRWESIVYFCGPMSVSLQDYSKHSKQSLLVFSIPHIIQTSRHIWSGMYKQTLIRPLFFNGTLTAEKCTEILQGPSDFLEECVSIQYLSHMWLQHGGVLAHKFLRPHNALTATFVNNIIGHGRCYVALAIEPLIFLSGVSWKNSLWKRIDKSGRFAK